MPKAFTKCVEEGGKVITKSLSKTKFMHLCKDKQGDWHKGETKIKKVKK